MIGVGVLWWPAPPVNPLEPNAPAVSAGAAASVPRSAPAAFPSSGLPQSPNDTVFEKPTASGRSELLQRILSNATAPSVSVEDVHRWLVRNRTNAESLLAAAQVGNGQECLLKALELYPDDPRVLCASIRLNDSAEARRQRLDRFKSASPDNALPRYLSAREHLKQSQPEQAVADLVEASRLQRFEDYSVEAMQTAEELYLSAGLPAVEAKVLGVSSVLLPHLAQLKDLAVGLMDLRENYLAAGDHQSADNLTRHVLQLGDQLTQGDGSRFVINQLVGAAIQQIALNRLEPTQTYDFLAASVAEQKTRALALRDEIKQDNKMFEQWLATAEDDRIMSYFDRIKLYGERRALEWLKSSR